MRNIIVVDCVSTGVNYIEDIANRGYNPVILELQPGELDIVKYNEKMQRNYDRIEYDYDLIYEIPHVLIRQVFCIQYLSYNLLIFSFHTMKITYFLLMAIYLHRKPNNLIQKLMAICFSLITNLLVVLILESVD